MSVMSFKPSEPDHETETDKYDCHSLPRRKTYSMCHRLSVLANSSDRKIQSRLTGWQLGTGMKYSFLHSCLNSHVTVQSVCITMFINNFLKRSGCHGTSLSHTRPTRSCNRSLALRMTSFGWLIRCHVRSGPESSHIYRQ